jgi:hypothetical protein
VPPDWFEETGIGVEKLRTPYGPLSYAARRRGKALVFEVKGATPPGGFVIPWPGPGEPGRALLNGKPAAWQDGELRFSVSPARVVLQLR